MNERNWTAKHKKKVLKQKIKKNKLIDIVLVSSVMLFIWFSRKLRCSYPFIKHRYLICWLYFVYCRFWLITSSAFGRRMVHCTLNRLHKWTTKKPTKINVAKKDSRNESVVNLFLLRLPNGRTENALLQFTDETSTGT